MKKRTETTWFFGQLRSKRPQTTTVFPRVARTLLLLFFLAPVSGCKKEGKKVREAYEKVFKYSEDIQGRDLEMYVKRKLPDDVWRVRDNREIFNRPRLEVEVDMPYKASPSAIKKRLKDLTTRAIGGTAAKAVRVRAWPKNLRRYGGIMGVSVLARDGGGWAGERVAYRQLKVTLNMKDGLIPTRYEYSVLLALEKLHAELLEKKKKLSKLQQKNPEKAEAYVIKQLAAQKGLTAASVRKMVEKARAYYLQEPF